MPGEGARTVAKPHTDKGADVDPARSPWTVYFAFSITVLFALLWRNRGPVDRVPIAAAAVMAMTWGDGPASMIGQSVGKRYYTLLGHTRSWEGTTAMVCASFVAIGATLLLLSSSRWSPFSTSVALGEGLLAALVAAGATTAAEGLSPAGTDNLAVPLLTAPVLHLLIG